MRNAGGGGAGPVLVTLALPPGMTAIPSGPPPVFCPGGTGSVTCGTDAGLAPGDSVTLLFRLVTAPGSSNGTVTGGTATTIRVLVNTPGGWTG